MPYKASELYMTDMIKITLSGPNLAIFGQYQIRYLIYVLV